MSTLKVYESEKLRGVTGPAIRPGGFDLTEKAVTFCRMPKGAFVLDVGCGSGATMEYLKVRHGLKAFGLDLSELLLWEGLNRNRALPLIRGDASFIPMHNARLSAVFCECVLSLICEPDTVLKEFFRIIEPGGFLIVTDIYLRTPGEGNNFGCMSFDCCLKGAMSRHRTQEIISNAGFTLLTWEDHSNLLKVLAAKMIFAYGSMEKFWSSFCGGGESAGVAEDVNKFRPGYYFLAAKKREVNHWMNI